MAEVRLPTCIMSADSVLWVIRLSSHVNQLVSLSLNVLLGGIFYLKHNNYVCI